MCANTRVVATRLLLASRGGEVEDSCQGEPPTRPAYTGPVSTIDIAKLSARERLELLEQVWDSLCDTPEAVPMTDAQLEELDRRLDDLDREGPVGIPWNEVLDRIRHRSR